MWQLRALAATYDDRQLCKGRRHGQCGSSGRLLPHMMTDYYVKGGDMGSGEEVGRNEYAKMEECSHQAGQN